MGSAATGNDVLHIGFNQDFGCLAVGTKTGFRIYNFNPFKETFRREFPEGGVGHVEMLFRCNILALVGGGKHPRWPATKVIIWDDHQNRCIGELSFTTPVRNVKLRRNRIIVVLDNTVQVYNFANLKLLDQVQTMDNPKGLVAVSSSQDMFVMACFGLKKGEVLVQQYDMKKTTWITAHESDLAHIALNIDGTRLATASQKGTLVRIFDTTTGQAVQELRRGVDRVLVNCISFSYDSQYICVSSNKGTIHVFAVHSDTSSNGSSLANELVENKRSKIAVLRKVLPKYFSSEWSFAQFRVPDETTLCAFGPDKTSLLIVSTEGNFYKCSFDPVKGGECRQDAFAKFIRSRDDGL